VARLLAIFCLALTVFAARTAFAADPHDAELFELSIRPVLAGTCFKCHGGESTGGNLRVDSREALLAGGERGPALTPGKPDESLLLKALKHADPEVQMPPEGQLAAGTIDAFSRWIETGAEWPAAAASNPFESKRHWAFQPIARVEPPTAAPGDSANAIDRFIAARLREEGIPPTARAERGVLLRRVYFDLIGLPPEPEELASFVAKDSPDALTEVVERLLASPRYGERWGRHWLDVARYADTAGDNADYPIPEARLYRDYVIDAFNADKPFDAFIREQLAGDLLAAAQPEDRQGYAEKIAATGFLALSRRYATAPYELWHLTLEDAVDTTGRAFLGLTFRCARCHDHKFDPLTQEDYYALYGVFESTQFPWAGGEEFQSKQAPRQHFVPLVGADQTEPLVAAMAAEIERLTKQLTEAQNAADKDSEAGKQRIEKLERELKPWQQAQKLDAPPGLSVAYAVRDGKPIDAHVQLRGEPENRGAVVPRGVPKFLAGETPPVFPANASGRLELAQWLTRPNHPLVARVIANRVWQWHFGRGLVATPSNFGLRGEQPTHPELLDWLATRLIDSRWSLKTLHREIVLSETYARSSAADAEALSRDPGNRWYGRGDRRRLDAESLRDAMLAVSGRLNTNRPGEHPFPPVGKWHWTQHKPFKASYESAHRSVYLMTQRIQRHPYLSLFDGPDTNTSSEVRTSATVPSQALFLLNNPFVVDQAKSLAERLAKVADTPEARIELATQLCFSRRPSDVEIARGTSYVQQARSAWAASGASADRLEVEAWASYARILLAANEFIYLD